MANNISHARLLPLAVPPIEAGQMPVGHNPVTPKSYTHAITHYGRIHYPFLLIKGKYAALAEMEVTSTSWQELQPAPPFYLFVPQAAELRAEYERGWPVNAIFPVNSVGIVTARDHLAIRWSPAEVWETVKDFAALPEEEARDKYKPGKDARDWKVNLAQADLRNSGPDRKLIVPILCGIVREKNLSSRHPD